MNRLQGKVAIVTGAAGGLGLAGVRAMASEGAQVVMMDLSPATFDRAKELVAEGFEVTAIVGDVSAEADIAATVALAKNTYGRLDILWSNAGLVSPEWYGQDTDAVGITLDYLMQTLKVNTGSVLLGAKHAIPVMAETGGGSIINTSSLAAAGGDLTGIAYGTSKAAINHLTRSVATAFGHLGIRSNAIAPGLIPPPAAAGPHKLEDSMPTQVILDSQMIPTPGEREDVANTVVFLASDESKFITGQVLYVDGGSTGHLATLSDRRHAPAATT
ncbi:SDR family oxidoreductase [Kribbella sandramycini]|uniref:NAD(P)-dependent dehydrogenase (Short-subunit alcohol dehydrogenase family) n=1 Tax=Kribbella sandramycini TaxID=60450 RepID=A0A7Y4KX75_9ACTN|nr:SDR family oxidoreductase [Kribbella sandramycini]MBB6567747.1 NAD(P)-dependent dehydrogenase (short-subunit alcohol dehydrogenase family) [Kribbella sandramycini]NOL39657.1 SDR family oxidoreductase [Kribbella sandramycini]